MLRLLVLAALCVPVEWLAAQSAPVVAPGTRVRIRTVAPSGAQLDRFEGTIARVSGDSITMLPNIGGRRTLYLPSADTQLYVLTGHRSSLLRGTAIGGTIGIFAGGFWGLVRQPECTGNKFLCINRKSLAVKEAVVISAAGAVMGLAFGALDRREVWTRAWMVDADSDVVTGRGELKLGFQLAF